MIKTSRLQRKAQGTASLPVRATWRACWACDCDGGSHEAGGYRPDGAQRAIDAIRAHIEQLTGHAPPSCPWRAMYDPLVQEVVAVVELARERLGAVQLGDDPAGIVLDGLRVYLAARSSAQAHYDEQDQKRWEADLAKKRQQHGRKR